MIEIHEGDHIVYPMQGLGVVVGRETHEFKGVPQSYVKIYFQSNNLNILLPETAFDNPESTLRLAVSKEDAGKILSKLETLQPQICSDWKVRYRNNLTLLKEGTLEGTAEVAKTLYIHSKIKDLPAAEKKLLDTALSMLIDELTLSLEEERETIEALIFSKVENSSVEIESVLPQDDTVAEEEADSKDEASASPNENVDDDGEDTDF